MFERIEQVIRHGQFIQGPEVFQFEKELAEYLGCKYVISCANGTDALQVALMALGVRQGQEVIMPSFTYAAVAEVALLLGLKPVFCDVDEFTFTIDPVQIKASINSNTCAIIPVHLFGQCAYLEPILEVAGDIPVIEDTAQALGAEYIFKNGTKKKAGTIGKIGITSFFPSKNLACMGDGGALFTNDDILAEKIRMICNHGQREKYNHEILGVNSRLDTIQAVVLSERLKTLDQKIKDRIDWANHQPYNVFKAPWSTHTFHQYTIKKRIPGNRVYYPLPLHKQKAYYQDISLPVSEWLSNNVCSL
jgi:dTDP-4-amino-4,6-dideoxygalactose transaminase